MTTTAPATADASAADHAVRCLEVWGGTQAVDTTLTIPGIDAWVFSRPYHGEEAGGDIHYVSSCFTGRVARFVVADVSGHGQTVAHLSSVLRKLMRKHINYLDQTGLARMLNTEFAAADQTGKFATAVMLSYFAPTDHLIVCNAGHPRPLWYHAAERTWRLLMHDVVEQAEAPDSVRNLPLGIVEPTNYVQFAVKLSLGDLVLIYTDALIEARRNGDGALLGEEGLLDLARQCSPTSPQAFGQSLLQALETYRGGTPADDDQTLLVLHHNASEATVGTIRGAIRAIGDMLGLSGD